MTLNRRRFVVAGLGAGATVHAANAASKIAAAAIDQTRTLQAAIDAAASQRIAVVLPAGTFTTGPLTLRSGSVVMGTPGLTTLRHIGSGPLLIGANAAGVRLAHLTIDGAMRPLSGQALISLDTCLNLDIDDLTITNAAGNGLSIKASTGRVCKTNISKAADAGLFALDSTLTISDNTVTACGNNGILVWRSSSAEDGSRVANNTINNIRADGGGSGQNGNAINIFRAGSVQVSGNRITDCAYSAIRGNAASNLAITANHCQRIGEVALYAEFGFTGALISANVVDTAACGVSVTNFNEGGRLAVVQGNLIRNVMRREHEPIDKRGEGIAVEADTLVSGNTIENAATCGILLGWKQYMRDVSATGNLVRGCPIGILISSDAGAGSAVVTNNLISGAINGAVRAHDQGHAVGPDLARSPPTTGRLTVSGNSGSG